MRWSESGRIANEIPCPPSAAPYPVCARNVRSRSVAPLNHGLAARISALGRQTRKPKVPKRGSGKLQPNAAATGSLSRGHLGNARHCNAYASVCAGPPDPLVFDPADRSMNNRFEVSPAMKNTDDLNGSRDGIIDDEPEVNRPEFYRPRCEIFTSVADTRLVPQMAQRVSYFVHYPPRDLGGWSFRGDSS